MEHEQRRYVVGHALRRDHYLAHVIAGWDVEHDIAHDALEHGAQAAGSSAALQCLVRDRAHGVAVEGQTNSLELEDLVVLLEQRVLRLLKNSDQRVFVERLQRDVHRQTADQLGDQTEAQQIFRLDLAQNHALPLGADHAELLAEADLALTGALLDDLLQTIERTAADEQDVARV